MTSDYSISLIRDPARGTSQSYLRVAWTSELKQFFLKLSSYSFYGKKRRMCNFTAAHFHLKGGGGLTVKATLFDSRIKSVTRHAIIVTVTFINVLLLKCGLPHDTVIVCVRPGQYPLKKDDLTCSSPEAAFLLVEVFYLYPTLPTRPGSKPGSVRSALV